MDKTYAEMVKGWGLKQVLNWLDTDPERNIPKVLDWVDRLDSEHCQKPKTDAFRAMMADPDNHWRKYILSLWSDIDPKVRRKVFETFLVNATIIGMKRQKQYREKYDCNIPWAILMDPTSACNLHCTGCWAADYGNRLNLTHDQWESIIEQGKKLGTFFYIYSGGEPMVRKKEIIEMCRKHPDCLFLSFTNGTLIDEQFADEMLQVGNFVPAISIEGFEEATDFRRGAGTYQAVIKAMEILKRKKLLFGMSCCYTSRNVEVIGSDAYFDDMIARGAKFAWMFTYMPIGKDAVLDLMATDEQRKFMYRKLREMRKSKPIFTLDFWNDGEFVNGCIAGGRYYCHINANGDVEPCAFIHYSDSNIKDKTLLEAFTSPLFRAYHDGQPFNDNLLRPCPLLDNPTELPRMVDSSGAHSTDLVHPEDVHDLAAKCEEKAAKWAPTADALWAEHPHADHKTR